MTQAITSSLRVLRIAHHGVVSAWRQRERELGDQQVQLRLVSAKRWNEGGRLIDLDTGEDHFVTGVRTLGTHPNAFIYSPGPLWRLLGQDWDLIDLHEEPFSLATAEVLLLRALRRAQTPFVLYSAQNIDKRYPVPFRWFERCALTRAAGAYVCNTEAGRILRRKGLRAPLRLIGLGTDVGLFTPSGRRQPQTPLHVGYVGRLEAHKGVHVLLAALTEGADWLLSIAGEGPQRTESEALAEQLGVTDRVTFRGHLGDRLPDFYRELDVLVVPSLPTPGWREQFGRVVIEAMASGVPVIASRSGALPDVVAEAGLLVEPADPRAIAEAIAEVSQPQWWSQLREAGLAHARQFDWPAIAAAHRQFYDDALGAARSAAPGVTAAARAGSGSAAGDPAPAAPAPAEPPQIVVVAYGPAEPLAEAIRPLTGFSITIVDNSSSPETRAVAERSGAHYIDPGANLGFAAGVNTGLDSLAARGLDATDVLLLNPDATVSAEAIAALQAGLHQDPRLACVGPVQTHPDTGGPERVSWPFPSPGAAWLEALGLGRLNSTAGFVIGSVLLLRAAAVADVGRLDERFFLYAEETDWQRRAVARGWTTGIVDTATATHVGAGTGGDSTVRMQMFNSSLLAYMDKHFGRSGELRYRAAVVTGALIRSVLAQGETRTTARWRLGFYTKAPWAGGAGKQPVWT